MSKPAKVNFQIYQGATFRKTVRLLTYPYDVKLVDGVIVNAATGLPADEADLIPVNLTGCTARMQVREAVDAADVLLELTTASGGLALTPLDGVITLYVSDEDTALLEWTRGVYDLEIEFANGDVVRRLYGTVSVSPEVTRV